MSQDMSGGLPALGPPPFEFRPADGERTEGAAFSFPFKVLTTVVTFAAPAWMLWQSFAGAGPVLSPRTSIFVWFVAAMALMGFTWWSILRSRSSVDALTLRQTWLWDKELPLAELAYARLIRVRGLESVIAPRLYARTLMGKFTVIYAADPRLLADFERLCTELTRFRRSGA